jgi:hypothetical protein
VSEPVRRFENCVVVLLALSLAYFLCRIRGCL